MPKIHCTILSAISLVYNSDSKGGRKDKITEVVRKINGLNWST